MDELKLYIHGALAEATSKETFDSNGVTKGRWGNGCFVDPTVVARCSDEMTIVKEEIFGPVMSVLTFKTRRRGDRARQRDGICLSAGLFTRDIQKAHRAIAQLEAGTCCINNYNITLTEMPFGGNKQSGIGRENSLAAIEHYTQLNRSTTKAAMWRCRIEADNATMPASSPSGSDLVRPSMSFDGRD